MMLNITTSQLNDYLTQASGKIIAVIGDVMLDGYLWGDVTRVSPEAPVPVVDITEKTYHLGGAANVAQNLISLGCVPVMCGLLGCDSKAEHFIEICNKLNIDSAGLYKDSNRITTTKTRVIGNQQQIVRIDNEVTHPINLAGENHIYNTVISCSNLAGIIFEDYDKGTISSNLIKRINKFANTRNIPIFVDPKLKYFADYSGATLFKPNKKETETNLNFKLNTIEDVITAGKMLLNTYNIKNVLITLGADGMMLFEEDGNIKTIPTFARRVADVSGAGDTVISCFAAMYSAGASLSDAATISNLAAGIICETPGVVAIKKDDLFQSIIKFS